MITRNSCKNEITENVCMCAVALRQHDRMRSTDWQKIAALSFRGFWRAQKHFSAEFAALLIMSRLKADKLIHRASDSWHFMIRSTGRLRGESHLFKASDEQKHGSDFLIYPEKKKKNRLWNVLMKMSHFLLSLLISPEKLISNHDLISHSAFSQAVDAYLDGGLICFPF